MPEPINTTILDPDTLARLDAEFRAGAFDATTLPPAPPLDPATDPFGMGYAWLDPEDTFAGVYAAVAGRFPSDVSRTSATEFRRLNPAGGLASGTDQQLFEAWVRDGFVTLCRSSGGDLLDRISLAPGPSADLTREVTAVLRRLPGFDELDPSAQVAIAFTATDLAREHLWRE